MGSYKSRVRRHLRRLRKLREGHGPGVSRLSPGDPEYCEYARYLTSPRRMFMTNFMAGLARGIGMAVGFSLLGAFVVYLLQQLSYRSIPWLGDFISRVVDAVQAKR